jgi:Zn-dependent oligopeptidase
LGADSVPADFVEAPSQMLEKWLQDPAVIRKISKHYQTNEPLPEDTLQSLVNSKRVFIGHYYAKQVAFDNADLRIHSYRSSEEIPPTYQDLCDATNEDFDDIFYKVPKRTCFLASFGHLFAGYDAQYYGYAWADAIASDLATPFKHSAEGFLDAKIGARFRKEVLEPGNSRDVTESIEAFLGRKWNTNALFQEIQLNSESASTSGTSGLFFHLLLVVILVVVLSFVAIKKWRQGKTLGSEDPSEHSLVVPLASYGSTSTS